MTAVTTDGDKLRMRMQRIRNRMHAKVDGLRLDAENLLDWRYLVCQFPLASVATAAVMGFWLMPGHRVTPTVKLDERSIDNIVQQGAARAEEAAREEAVRIAQRRRSDHRWWKPLMSLGMNMATKAALAYVGQQFVQRMEPPHKKETAR